MHYCNLPETRTKIGVEVGDNTDFLLFGNDNKKIQNIIKRFIDYQYDKGLSPSTVRVHYNAIKHFYESNEIVLNWALVRDWVGSLPILNALWTCLILMKKSIACRQGR